jgi:hypothetical protein
MSAADSSAEHKQRGLLPLHDIFLLAEEAMNALRQSCKEAANEGKTLAEAAVRGLAVVSAQLDRLKQVCDDCKEVVETQRVYLEKARLQHDRATQKIGLEVRGAVEDYTRESQKLLRGTPGYDQFKGYLKAVQAERQARKEQEESGEIEPIIEYEDAVQERKRALDAYSKALSAHKRERDQRLATQRKASSPATQTPRKSRPDAHAETGTAAPGQTNAHPPESEATEATGPKERPDSHGKPSAEASGEEAKSTLPPENVEPAEPPGPFERACQEYRELVDEAVALRQRFEKPFPDIAGVLDRLRQHCEKSGADLATASDQNKEQELLIQVNRMVVEFLRKVDRHLKGKGEDGKAVGGPPPGSPLREPLELLRARLFQFAESHSGVQRYPVSPGDRPEDHDQKLITLDAPPTEGRIDQVAKILLDGFIRQVGNRREVILPPVVSVPRK